MASTGQAYGLVPATTKGPTKTKESNLVLVFFGSGITWSVIFLIAGAVLWFMDDKKEKGDQNKTPAIIMFGLFGVTVPHMLPNVNI
jgi:hypothetical protein